MAISIHNLVSILMIDPWIDGRTVIDKTGLTGTYDFSLDWAPLNAADAAGPSLFTAIEEQLGLKLVAAKGPVQVVVIDHIEPASEN